jgi:uncharacterized protein YkwD
MGWGTRAATAAAICCTLAAPAWANASDAERAVVDAVNRARERHGLGALHAAPALERSAGRYARWMLRADYFGHRAKIATKARFHRLGENLALAPGRGSRARPIVRTWMHSPAHRALILSPGYGWAGAGVAHGRLRGRVATTWVMHFGG